MYVVLLSGVPIINEDIDPEFESDAIVLLAYKPVASFDEAIVPSKINSESGAIKNEFGPLGITLSFSFHLLQIYYIVHD